MSDFFARLSEPELTGEPPIGRAREPQTSLFGELGVGFRGEVAGAIGILRNLAGGARRVAELYSKSTGLPIDRALGEVESWFTDAGEAIAPKPEEVSGEGVTRKVIRGVGAFPVQMLEYGAGIKLLKNPILAFAAVDAAREMDKGFWEATKAGAIGAATGAAMGQLPKIKARPKRAAAGAAITGAIAGAQGGGIEDITAAALTGGALGAITKPNAPLEGVTIKMPQSDLTPILDWFQSPSNWSQLYPPAREAVVESIQRQRNSERLAGDWTNRARRAFESVANEERYYLDPAGKQRDKLVEALNDARFTVASPPPGSPKLQQAFKDLRGLTEDIRQQVIKTKRSIGQNVANDWGIPEGWFPHNFEGPWAILHDGKPIPTGYLAGTIGKARDRAAEYIELNPGAKGRVTIESQEGTAKGRDPLNPTERQRYVSLRGVPVPQMTRPQFVEYRRLYNKVQQASFGMGRGERFFGHIQERAKDLPGWIDADKALYDYVSQAARYSEMAQLRPKLLSVKADIEANMPRNSEFRRMWNIYIDRVEGRPDALTQGVNDRLLRRGLAPNFVQRASSFIRSAEVLAKLGISPVSALANSSQVALNTLPVLGPEYTWKGITGTYEFFKGKGAKAREYRDLVDKLNLLEGPSKDEMFSIRQTMELYWPKKIQDAPAWGQQVASTLGLWWFSKAERANRLVTAIGAWEKARARGQGVDEAMRTVKDVDLRTQFFYGVADTPVALSNPWTRTLFQFQNFFLKQIEFMTGLADWRKDLPGRLDTGPRELGRFLLTTLGASGFVGVPGAETLDWLIFRATGGKDSPLEEIKQQWSTEKIPGAAGYAATALSRGLPGLIGVDLTKNVGFGDWFTLRSLGNPYTVIRSGPVMQEVMMAIKARLAPPGRERDRIVDDLLMRISPEARRIYQSYISDASQRGEIVDRAGKPIVKDLTSGERFFNALGLTPLRLSEARDKYLYQQEKILYAKSEKLGYADAMVDHYLNGEQAEMQRLAGEAQQAGYPDIWQTFKTVLRDRQRERLETQQRRYRRLLGPPQEQGAPPPPQGGSELFDVLSR